MLTYRCSLFLTHKFCGEPEQLTILSAKEKLVRASSEAKHDYEKHFEKTQGLFCKPGCNDDEELFVPPQEK